MGDIEFQEALKMGKKEYKSRVSRGQFPYLPVLDEILSRADIQTEQNMGLVHVPLDFIVGTTTVGRTYSFAGNFMPILEEGTEFAVKWAALSDAQMNEGIRDPIIVYEYMNRYYVLEGNKRVSVLKYFKAFSIPAIVTRKIPRYSEDYDVKLYYEYMKFNEITGLFTIEFSKLGQADKLLNLVGKTDKWDEKTKEDFNKVVFDFTKAYNFRGGNRIPITLGDAITAFMSVYGFEAMLKMSEDEYSTNILKTWNEFGMLTEEQTIDLVLDPREIQEKKSLLSYLIPTTQKKFTVAFLYTKDAETSDWVYAHDLGRNYLEETFSEQLQTICVDNIKDDEIEDALNDVIARGASIIFGIAPQMMQASLKVAVEHPEVKILNCSLNTSHQYIRTYYGRMYEAKFLSGLLAGILTDNDKIAYIADYPIYGMIANINAFALGVACTNPRAKVYLAWSTSKNFDREEFLFDNDIHYVSDQDMITPRDASRQFGFYKFEAGVATNLLMPVWNWGAFYEKMIQSILAGSYQAEGNAEKKALNYWWGMSAGVIDMIFSNNIPVSVRRLLEHCKNDICTGEIVPFHDEIRTQDGTIKNRANESMSPQDIMEMDYLVDNVIGSIPAMNELVDDAKTIVELKGVEENK